MRRLHLHPSGWGPEGQLDVEGSFANDLCLFFVIAGPFLSHCRSLSDSSCRQTQGILDAAKEVWGGSPKVPLVVRLQGNNVEGAMELMKNSDIKCVPSLWLVTMHAHARTHIHTHTQTRT